MIRCMIHYMTNFRDRIGSGWGPESDQNQDVNRTRIRFLSEKIDNRQTDTDCHFAYFRLVDRVRVRVKGV